MKTYLRIFLKDDEPIRVTVDSNMWGVNHQSRAVWFVELQPDRTEVIVPFESMTRLVATDQQPREEK